MIGWIMGTRLGRALAAAAAAIAAVGAVFLAGRRGGRKDAERERMEVDLERSEHIREKAADARRGAPRDVDDADERLRRAGRLRD